MKQLTPIVALATASLLAACGGASSPPPPAGTGPAAPAALALSGAISSKAAGTMTVAGLVVDTTAAVVRIEKQVRPEAELHHGMVVRVKGTFDRSTGTARATEVQFEDHAKGRSAADVAPGATTIAVGGRTVHIEDSTRVMDDSGADIAPETIRRDDRLRVSGFADDQGRLRASSVERLAAASADDSAEAKGFVIAIAADRASFDLGLVPGGALAFHVTMASGTLPAAVAVGSWVEVRSLLPANGTSVTADSVTLEDHGLGDAGAEAEVEGIVTGGDSSSFQVDGQVVVTSAATRWENGVAGDLVPGVKVEAEGHLDGSGNLVAEKVSFRESSRLQGPVAGPAGSLAVLGIPLTVAGTAEGAALLVAGQVVEVRGYPRSDGVGLVVTRVKAVGGGNPRSFLQGPVSAVNAAAGTLQILGVTVTSAGASFSDHEQVSLTRDAFFGKVIAGRSVVKARLTAEPAGIPPTAGSDELELEDEPGPHG
ncbi:MAG TPA: DUF5666 domain-containing protein [Anaeromyxobacteraceae bacterium]|nr:DUF5666 domain-containing protein [Anaeromyxobacteraceae bacterium]